MRCNDDRLAQRLQNGYEAVGHYISGKCNVKTPFVQNLAGLS